MGHFGRKPIAVAWYGIVLPGLLLYYFGQAALLIREPGGDREPLLPDGARTWAVTPLAVLATMASVIASQALISGAFSLTVQAVQLDYLPRVEGPPDLRAAPGPGLRAARELAADGRLHRARARLPHVEQPGRRLRHRRDTTMVITSLIFYVVARRDWGWSAPKAIAVVTPAAPRRHGLPRRRTSRRSPRAAGSRWSSRSALLVQMTTWRTGRQLVAARIRRGERPIREVLEPPRPRRAGRRGPRCSCSRTSGRRRPRWSTTCATTRWCTRSR